METGPLTNDAAAAAARAAAEAARRAAEEAAARAAAEAAAKAAAEDNAPPEPSGAIDLPPVDEIQKGKGFDDPFETGDDGEDGDFTAMADNADMPLATPADDPGARMDTPASGTTPLPPTGKPEFDAYQAIETAEAELDKAQKDLEEKQKELAALLADTGPGLTDEQKVKVQEEFWKKPENGKAVGDRANAQANYDRVLEANVKAVADNYAQALASGNKGDIADFQAQLDGMLKKAGPAAGRIGQRAAATILATPGVEKTPGIGDKLMGELITPYMAENVAARVAAGEKVENVYAQLKGELSGMFHGQKFGGTLVNGTFDILEKLGEAEKIADPVKKAAYLGGLAKGVADGPLRGVALVGVFAGSLSIGDAASQGDYWGAAKEAIGTAKDAGDLLGNFKKFEGVLGKNTFYAKRLGPVVGALASTIATVQALGKFASSNGEDKRYLALAAANAASGVAVVLAATVLTGPVGIALVALTAIGTAVVEHWISEGDKAKLKARNLELLAAVVAPPEYAKRLVETDPKHLKLMQDAGMTPEQMRQLHLDGLQPSPLDPKNGSARQLFEELARFNVLNQGLDVNVYYLLGDIERNHKGPPDRRQQATQELTAAFRIVRERAQLDPTPQPTAFWQEQFRLLAGQQQPYVNQYDPSFPRVAAAAQSVYTALPAQTANNY